MLKCSHLFNPLDARGAISVTERVGVIERVRKLAVGVAQAWVDQQTARGGGGRMSLPFLLEIGTEEIPDWMIPGALESLRAAVREAGRSRTERGHAWMRRRAAWCCAPTDCRSGRPISEELVHGPGEIRARPGAWRGSRASRASRPRTSHVEIDRQGRVLQLPASKIAGPRDQDILAEALPGIILKIYFPKTMYWTGKSGPRFIRPIRWIVALLGDEVVPFEIGRRAVAAASPRAIAGWARAKSRSRSPTTSSGCATTS